MPPSALPKFLLRFCCARHRATRSLPRPLTPLLLDLVLVEDEEEDEEEEEEEEEREANSRRMTTKGREEGERAKNDVEAGGALSGSALGAGESETIPGVVELQPERPAEVAAARTSKPSLSQLSADESFTPLVLLAFLRSRCLCRCLDPLVVSDDPRSGPSFAALLIVLAGWLIRIPIQTTQKVTRRRQQTSTWLFRLAAATPLLYRTEGLRTPIELCSN